MRPSDPRPRRDRPRHVRTTPTTAIEPHLGPAQTIVLDLSEVTFVDSSLLRLLVQACGRLTSDRGSLVLRNPSNAARRLLTAARARSLLDEEARTRIEHRVATTNGATSDGEG